MRYVILGISLFILPLSLWALDYQSNGQVNPQNPYQNSPYSNQQSPYGQRSPYANAQQNAASNSGNIYVNSQQSQSDNSNYQNSQQGVNPNAMFNKPVARQQYEQAQNSAPNIQMSPQYAQAEQKSIQQVQQQQSSQTQTQQPYPQEPYSMKSVLQQGEKAKGYTQAEKRAWFSNCEKAVTNNKVSKFADEFCGCGWKHISSGELPPGLLSSTNAVASKKRQEILQSISQQCIVELMAQHNLQ